MKSERQDINPETVVVTHFPLMPDEKDTNYTARVEIAEYLAQKFKEEKLNLKSGYNIGMTGCDLGSGRKQLLIAISSEQMMGDQARNFLKKICKDEKWKILKNRYDSIIGDVVLIDEVKETAAKYGHNKNRWYPQLIENKINDDEKEKLGKNTIIIDKSSAAEIKISWQKLNGQWGQEIISQNDENFSIFAKASNERSIEEKENLYASLPSLSINYMCSEPRLAAEREKLILLYPEFKDMGESHFAVYDKEPKPDIQPRHSCNECCVRFNEKLKNIPNPASLLDVPTPSSPNRTNPIYFGDGQAVKPNSSSVQEHISSALRSLEQKDEKKAINSWLEAKRLAPSFEKKLDEGKTTNMVALSKLASEWYAKRGEQYLAIAQAAENDIEESRNYEFAKICYGAAIFQAAQDKNLESKEWPDCKEALASYHIDRALSTHNPWREDLNIDDLHAAKDCLRAINICPEIIFSDKFMKNQNNLVILMHKVGHYLDKTDNKKEGEKYFRIVDTYWNKTKPASLYLARALEIFQDDKAKNDAHLTASAARDCIQAFSMHPQAKEFKENAEFIKNQFTNLIEQALQKEELLQVIKYTEFVFEFSQCYKKNDKKNTEIIKGYITLQDKIAELKSSPEKAAKAIFLRSEYKAVQPRKASNQIQNLAEEAKNDFDKLIEEGNEHFLKNKYKKALECYEKAIFFGSSKEQRAYCFAGCMSCRCNTASVSENLTQAISDYKNAFYLDKNISNSIKKAPFKEIFTSDYKSDFKECDTLIEQGKENKTGEHQKALHRAELLCTTAIYKATLHDEKINLTDYYLQRAKIRMFNQSSENDIVHDLIKANQDFKDEKINIPAGITQEERIELSAILYNHGMQTQDQEKKFYYLKIATKMAGDQKKLADYYHKKVLNYHRQITEKRKQLKEKKETRKKQEPLDIKLSSHEKEMIKCYLSNNLVDITCTERYAAEQKKDIAALLCQMAADKEINYETAGMYYRAAINIMDKPFPENYQYILDNAIHSSIFSALKNLDEGTKDSAAQYLAQALFLSSKEEYKKELKFPERLEKLKPHILEKLKILEKTGDDLVEQKKDQQAFEAYQQAMCFSSSQEEHDRLYMKCKKCRANPNLPDLLSSSVSNNPSSIPSIALSSSSFSSSSSTQLSSSGNPFKKLLILLNKDFNSSELDTVWKELAKNKENDLNKIAGNFITVLTKGNRKRKKIADEKGEKKQYFENKISELNKENLTFHDSGDMLNKLLIPQDIKQELKGTVAQSSGSVYPSFSSSSSSSSSSSFVSPNSLSMSSAKAKITSLEQKQKKNSNIAVSTQQTNSNPPHFEAVDNNQFTLKPVIAMQNLREAAQQSSSNDSSFSGNSSSSSNAENKHAKNPNKAKSGINNQTSQIGFFSNKQHAQQNRGHGHGHGHRRTEEQSSPDLPQRGMGRGHGRRRS